MPNTVHTEDNSVWTVLFMWKLLRCTILLLLVLGVIYAYSLYKDSQTLREQIIRLHVVADTDDPIDQEVKLLVRDEILSLLETVKSNASTKQEAIDLLQEQLPELQKAANDLLRNMGMRYNAEVTLQEEPFPARNYDTFSLPSGIYDSIRVTIGDGEGKNWWCVVFPDLCGAAAAVDVEDTAVEAGISDSLSKTLTQADGYQIRFWLLDCIGKLQIFF